MKPTPEQERAIETEGQPLLVEAGAGTGKTWVLVERFLHLLSAHPDWPLESIVAITFTEKATREMRSRIREAIDKRAEAEAAAMRSALWSKRQSELEELRVSTIHSLCSLMLRENAIAAGIDPHFDVLDELEAGLLKEEAIRQSLSYLADEGDSSLELLAALHIGDLRQELESLLEKRGSVQELFDRLPDSEELLSKWERGLAAMRTETWLDLMKADPSLGEAIEQMPLVTIVDQSDILSRAVLLAQEGCHLLGQEDLVGAASTWKQIKRNGGRSANWGGKEALRDLKLLLKALQAAAKGFEAAGANLEIGPEDEDAARWLQLWRGLWTALISRYDLLKEERHALDFDDLEILAEQLLYRHPQSRRLQDFISGIRHLMVDEFQDTNVRQGRIVYALAHPEDNGRLFVVGDAKQSIYRFRQAQVAVFNRTADDIRAVSGREPLPLSRSFRTDHDLLETLNDLFNRILQPIGNSYEDYEARPGPLSAHRLSPPSDSNVPVPVEMVVIPKKDSSENSVSAEMGRRWEAAWLAQRITSLRDGRFEVWDKKVQAYRHFQFGDAAIFFRATTNLPLYEEVFKREGLPYLTLSGRGYYDRPEIRDLLALLSCLYDPGDDLNLAAALRSPMFSFSDETLYRLRWRTANNERPSETIPLAKALKEPPPNDQNEAVEFALSVLSELWNLARRMEVWQLLRTALDRTGYEATLLLNDKKNGGSGRQYNNASKFMALVRERGGANLSDFLRRIQDIQLREAREGEAPGAEPGGQAVQLMSIHAAKGLEFPVVAMADLGRRTGGRIGSPRILHDPAYGLVCKGRDENGDWTSPASFAWASWMDKRMDEAESRRLLYVACTRAADLLILSGKVGERNSWLQKLLSAWEISPVGEDEEIISGGSYALRVIRLDAGLDERAQLGAEDQSGHRRADDSALTAAGEEPLLEIPALARKVDMSVEREPMSVSRMARVLSKEVGGYPEIRPVVNLDKEKSEQASHYLVGRVVHKALADWSCLAYLEPQLLDRLMEIARRAGAADEVAEDATAKARRLIRRVQSSPLYVQIDKAHSAHRFYSEVPFSLETEPVPLHGIVDLIYRDQAGLWHLIDWKTEWIGPNSGDNETVLEHRHQIAAYAVATERTLGVRPSVSLCFINPRFRPIRIPYEAVDKSWQEILEGAL